MLSSPIFYTSESDFHNSCTLTSALIDSPAAISTETSLCNLSPSSFFSAALLVATDDDRSRLGARDDDEEGDEIDCSVSAELPLRTSDCVGEIEVEEDSVSLAPSSDRPFFFFFALLPFMPLLCPLFGGKSGGS